MPEYQVISEMRSLLRSGFYNREQLIEMYSDEICSSCNMQAEQITAIIDDDLKFLDKEKKSWPVVTDCERLETTFKALESKGFITLENAGYMQSDSFNKINELHELSSNKHEITAYCFYHRTDLERAVRGMGLYLAFGPLDKDLEDTEGPIIGEIVRAELDLQGLDVEWDGTFNSRIFLPNIIWQKK